MPSDFLNRWSSASRSGKNGLFLVRLNGFQKETLRAQTPTAPRWKAHIETCQETRRMVVSGECCADRGPGSGAHAHTGRLPCVRRLGGQAHANVHSKRGHPHRAPHVRAGGDLSDLLPQSRRVCENLLRSRWCRSNFDEHIDSTSYGVERRGDIPASLVRTTTEIHLD